MKKPLVVTPADLTHAPKAKGILESAFEVQYVDGTADALAESLPGADAYYASLVVRITAELMALAPNLKAISTPSTGLDHIDLKAAAERDIAVLCLKEDRSLLDKITATAELAWALLLAASRYLPAAANAANQGEWARDRFRGHQIAYKTLGILGCGRLGTIVSQYGQAFRMKMIGYDTMDVEVPGVEQVSYDELLERSDVLSVHIHLNDENRRFVDAKSISKMKKGAVLINTSRGAIVDEQALVDALESGHLSAAGVDVIESEWRDDLIQHPMIAYARSHENLVITPHIGGVTYESQEMAYSAAAEKLVEFFKKS